MLRIIFVNQGMSLDMYFASHVTEEQAIERVYQHFPYAQIVLIQER